MADSVADEWPAEAIPDSAHIYRRVPPGLYRFAGGIFRPDGKPTVGAFYDRNHPESLSTDWDKYATPEYTRNGGKTPLLNGVVQLLVGDVRALTQEQGLEALEVRHTPDLPNNNRAHTDIFCRGADLLALRTRLWDYCVPVIEPLLD